jgi:chitodextrinase
MPFDLQWVSKTDSSISLAWQPCAGFPEQPCDNVSVAGYKVYENDELVGTSTEPSYVDTGLLAFTAYSYAVSSFDAANNESSMTFPLNVKTKPAFSHSCADLVCNFTDGNTSAVSWSWDFGDGESSTAQNPSHTYVADGTYTVTLTVTDGDVQSDSITQNVTIATSGSGTPDACDGLADGVHLAPSSTNQGRTWTAIVGAVKCSAGDEAAFAGTGAWNPDLGGSGCVTTSTGNCQAIQSGIRKKTRSVQFSLDGASETIFKP